jgi:uncharacterized membrane protein HdeD (DUF308 family)
MFHKWWVILIQGILMIILGFFIFKNPEEVLAGISIWAGILFLVTGIAGLLGWILAGKGERDAGSIIWSILTALFGLFILMNLFVAMKAFTIIFGIWILFTGFNLLFSGWSLKNENSSGWFLIIIGILSILAGIMMIFNINFGATGIATILGLVVLLTGIALIMLSFVKKMIVGKLKEMVNR